MPLDKGSLQALLRRESVDNRELYSLIRLAAKPELWEGLEVHEVLGVFRDILAESASGRKSEPLISIAGAAGRAVADHSIAYGALWLQPV